MRRADPHFAGVQGEISEPALDPGAVEAFNARYKLPEKTKVAYGGTLGIVTVEDIVENGGVRTAMLDVSFACHMPDCLEMPYKPAILGARDPEPGEKGWRMGGNSCLAGDYYGDWIFDRDLRVGDRIVFEDMIHYTMVKTTMFNGVAHPAIAIVRRDGAIEIIREFGYEDFKSRMS